ncbi:MAG: PAS domain S-box protein [Candidatus Thorarchaeota archaeon]
MMSGTKKRKKSPSKRKKSMKDELDSFQKALSILPIGIAIISNRGRIDYANKEFAGILGYEIDDLSGKTISKLISLDKDIQKQFTKPTLGLEQPLVFDIEIGQSDDTTKIVSFIVHPSLLNDHSVNAGQIIVIRDITTQRMKENELERVSHEIVCLRNVSRLLSQSEQSQESTLNTFVHMITEGWQYPEHTCARIILHDTESKSVNFIETKWFQTVDISVYGQSCSQLSIYYLKEMP